MASTAFIQTFLYCFFGEFITIKMERLTTVLYSTNWYDMNLKDRKSFMIILGVTQKAYGMKAGGMYNVNIYTFVQILKIALSWSTLILTLYAYE
ncbi:odorant receptor 33b-like [Phlebotomus papatasi]|nr:odorant receptor 33b-like [Phlebotomus papatasi]